jgi:hypothetical protein
MRGEAKNFMELINTEIRKHFSSLFGFSRGDKGSSTLLNREMFKWT